jgi:hypothetical protein
MIDLEAVGRSAPQATVVVAFQHLPAKQPSRDAYAVASAGY